MNKEATKPDPLRETVVGLPHAAVTKVATTHRALVSRTWVRSGTAARPAPDGCCPCALSTKLDSVDSFSLWVPDDQNEPLPVEAPSYPLLKTAEGMSPCHGQRAHGQRRGER